MTAFYLIQLNPSANEFKFYNIHPRYNVHDPKNASNDRFILSKGHAAPILYAAWAEAGLFPTEDLVRLTKTKKAVKLILRAPTYFGHLRSGILGLWNPSCPIAIHSVA